MRRLLASCFGIGCLRFAPGTYGSLVPVLFFVLFSILGMSSVWVFSSMVFLFLSGSAVCLLCGEAVARAKQRKDPGEIVADEIAGQSVVFLFALGFRSELVFVVAVLGFLLFRFFDIFKPWPVCSAEKLKGMWGVLADDLVAGLYGGVVLLVFLKSGLVERVAGFFGGSGESSFGIFEALVLGVVQGLTEFLPVSSSGHLVLLEDIFNLSPDSGGMLLFDLSVHVGTVVAIVVVFRKSILFFLSGLYFSGNYGSGFVQRYRRSPSVHILVLGVAATLVTGVLGFLFEDYFKSARGNIEVVSIMWLVTGSFLLITDFRKHARMGLREFGIIGALIVGLSQAVAIMPGISRSGATICAAILIGLRRRWAVEFSFLLAIPAILGATLIEIIKEFGELGASGLGLGVFLIGIAAAAVTGVLALKVLIRASRRRNLKYFAVYCYVLGVLVFVFYFLK